MSDFPYPGLRPFKQTESDIFFGRDDCIEALTNKLDSHHFIAVTGDSGCGKSSLVRAGLLSRLRTVQIGNNEHWRIANMRPGNQPFFRLADALLKNTDDPEKLALREEYLSYPHHKIKSENVVVSHLQKELLGDLEKSYKILEKILPDNHNLLIVVDQFEELFHHANKGEKEEVKYFIQWLLASCRPQKNKIYVVITMRSEFLEDCTQYGSLISAINHGFFQVPHPTRENLRETIELPAQIYEGNLEAALVDRLLDDVETMEKNSRFDHLLLLQHALLIMWLNVNDSPQKKLTLQHYQEIGNDLVVVLNQNAESACTNFSDIDNKTAEILFRRISRGDERGNYTRHPVKLKEIVNLANVSWQTVSGVVDQFRTDGRRFLFSREKPSSKEHLTANDEIDITHESIIRQWERLKQWADEEVEWAEFYQHWEKAAQRWNKRKGELWRKLDLDNALDSVTKIQRLYPKQKQLKLWASRYGKDSDLAWKFLEASKEAREEEQKLAEEAKKRELVKQVELEQHQKELNLSQEKLRLSRQRTRIVFAGLLGVAVFAGWGFWERQNAISAQQQAERSEQIRTESLFESYRRHAALLVQEEKYAVAQQTLERTYQLDSKVPASSRHARDLLARFISIISGKSQQDYHGAKAILYAIALSPDKQKLVAVGERGTVVLFEVKTGTLLQRFVGHDAKKHVKAVVFDPQGKWFATAGEDKQILQWSLTSNQPIQQWQTDSEIWALAINATEDLLASGGRDKVITLWNLSTGQKQTLSGHDGTIAGLAFSPNDQLLASASYDDTVRLWQVSNGQMRSQLKAHTDNVQEVIFSPNGQLLATSSDDETVRLWKVETGQNIALLKGHQDKVFGITFTEDGRYLASSSADATVRLWDVESGVTLRVFQGHTAIVTGLTTEGQNIFSSSADGTIKRWKTDLPYQYALDLSTPPSATAIAPDGNTVAIGFENGSVQGYSLSTHEQIWKAETVHQRDIQRLAFSPNSQWLATASLDNTATVWQIQANQLVSVATIQHQAGVNAVAFSPDGHNLLTASYDGQMGKLQLDTQNTQFYPLYQTDMNSVVWDASGHYVLTANDNRTYLWNWQDLQLTSKPKPIDTYPPTQETTWWAALSPNAQQVAMVGRYFVINVSPRIEGAEPYDLQGHKDTVIRAIFSPDNQQLATVGGDNTVRVWDLLQKSELFTITLPTKGKNVIWDFDFSCTPQGCWIAVPLSDRQQLRLYDLGKIYRHK